MGLLDDFIKQYNREYEYFDNHSKMIASKIEEQFSRRGIKAIITHRTKSLISLREKIKKNNAIKKYRDTPEIFRDIKDLSAARISLYFPLAEFVIDEIMNDAFFVIEKHQPLPGKQHNVYKKKYPGYQATHYHVSLKEKDKYGQYDNSIAEVQVGSTFIHAWAEIDHELVYKPSFGKPSIKELAMLDEVNGLALSAGLALKNLQHAMAERTIENGLASDKYELANLLLVKIKNDIFKKNRLGDVYLLQFYLETLDRNAFGFLLVLFKMIRPGSVLSIADQLLYMMLEKYYHPVKNPMHTYLRKLHFSNESISLANEFIGNWVTIAGRMKKMIENDATIQFQDMPAAFKILKKRKILTLAETAMLENLYAVKNNILHGIEIFPAVYLSNSLITLKEIATRLSDRK